MSEDTRYLALKLLGLCNAFEKKALAQNTVLGAIAHMAPEMRAVLTEERISEMVEEAKPAAHRIVDQESAELGQALSGDRDFLFCLIAYLGKYQ